MNRTTIIATVGPATSDEKSLLMLKNAGMDAVRLNGAHATVQWHKNTIETIRKTLPGTPILLDIPGRKVRTKQLEKEVVFSKNDKVVLTTIENSGDAKKIAIDHESLHEELQAGMIIWVDDGTIKLTVETIEGEEIICRAQCNGVIKSRKGINVPGVTLKTPCLTSYDRELVQLAKNLYVEFVGLSFVQSLEDVEVVRDTIDNNIPQIVAKIETRNAIESLVDIADASDYLMIDRGDLSVETNLEEIAIMQKHIIETAHQRGKPVIVATEMLHSMINNPHPTKAEVSDISNAVFDGAAALMLSGETAVGMHPEAAIKIMRKIADATEIYVGKSVASSENADIRDIPHAIDEAVALICNSLPIDKVVAVTKKGFAARMISLRNLRQPILAVSDDAHAARSFNLLPGTTGVHVDYPFTKTETNHVVACIKALWENRLLNAEDLVLVTAVVYPQSGNRMNLIQTHYIKDLMCTLQWKQDPSSQVISQIPNPPDMSMVAESSGPTLREMTDDSNF